MTATPIVLSPDVPMDRSGSNARAHTRLYRGGMCVLRDFPVADISEHLRDPASVVWLDLCRPTPADFDMVNTEFGLHELAALPRGSDAKTGSETRRTQSTSDV